LPDSGSAPNKTFIRSDGTRTGANLYQQEQSLGINIEAVNLDYHDQEIATALTNRRMLDGGNQPSASLPMNNFNHTGVAVGTARNHYAAVSQVQDGSPNYAGDSVGTNTITASLTPAITAYAAGMVVAFKAGGTNTSASTLNLNGLGAKSIKKGKTGSLDLGPGDIGLGKTVVGIYDGTNFQQINAPEFPSGTNMLFAQTVAPVGWTHNIAVGDHALRVVGDGSGGTISGSVAFTTAFASQTPTGTVGGTALTIAQMPAHTHSIPLNTGDDAFGTEPRAAVTPNVITAESGSTGGGATHTHTFTGNAINLAVARLHVILCAKD
jgi:hypothetical protein